MTEESVMLFERRLDNAMTARKNVGSCWGKNYWDNVIGYLMRQANRLN